MKFVKMQGIGNDYVFVDTNLETVPDPSRAARRISDRHFGVGSDGLILIGDSSRADISMRIFNADGSEAEMCGNGIRCVARYAWDHNLCHKTRMSVETKAGIRNITLFINENTFEKATVNMGQPRLRRSEIPMKGRDTDRVVDECFKVDEGTELKITCVSMGNPHCIVPVENMDEIDWKKIGSKVENHRSFPERTNVHFVEVISENEVNIVTWERGSGPTLACGTGASAVCVGMNMLGKTRRKIQANLPGGELELEWSNEDGCVYMTGPAEEVFGGEWELRE